MKIQLDYDSKTVSIDESVDLGKFIDTIEKILPKWKEWKLLSNTEIKTTPIYIPYPYYHRPWYEYFKVTYGTGTVALPTDERVGQPTTGVYCLSVGE